MTRHTLAGKEKIARPSTGTSSDATASVAVPPLATDMLVTSRLPVRPSTMQAPLHTGTPALTTAAATEQRQRRSVFANTPSKDMARSGGRSTGSTARPSTSTVSASGNGTVHSRGPSKDSESLKVGPSRAAPLVKQSAVPSRAAQDGLVKQSTGSLRAKGCHVDEDVFKAAVAKAPLAKAYSKHGQAAP